MIEIALIIEEAKKAIAMHHPDEALSILDNIVVKNSGEALFLKGEINYKLQNWGEALNHFSLFLEQYPTDKSAKAYCALIHNILGFYHKDLYNP